MVGQRLSQSHHHLRIRQSVTWVTLVESAVGEARVAPTTVSTSVYSPATTHGDVDGVCSWQKAVFPTIPREGAIHFPLAREGSTRSLGWPVGGFRFSKEAHEETKMGPEPIMCRSLGQSSAPRISVFPRTETRLGREV